MMNRESLRSFGFGALLAAAFLAEEAAAQIGYQPLQIYGQSVWCRADADQSPLEKRNEKHFFTPYLGTQFASVETATGLHFHVGSAVGAPLGCPSTFASSMQNEVTDAAAGFQDPGMVGAELLFSSCAIEMSYRAEARQVTALQVACFDQTVTSWNIFGGVGDSGIPSGGASYVPFTVPAGGVQATIEELWALQFLSIPSAVGGGSGQLAANTSMRASLLAEVAPGVFELAWTHAVQDPQSFNPVSGWIPPGNYAFTTQFSFEAELSTVLTGTNQVYSTFGVTNLEGGFRVSFCP